VAPVTSVAPGRSVRAATGRRLRLPRPPQPLGQRLAVLAARAHDLALCARELPVPLHEEVAAHLAVLDRDVVPRLLERMPGHGASLPSRPVAATSTVPSSARTTR